MTTQHFSMVEDDENDGTTHDDEIGEVDPFSIDPQPGRSALDELRDALKQSVEYEPLILEVPKRPSIKVSFNTQLDGELLSGWRKRCMPRKANNVRDFDELKFSSIVIANQAAEVIINGKPTGLNFRDGELLEMLQANGAMDGVRKLYGMDGHMMVAASKVLDAAGYGEDLEGDEDPTQAL